MRISSEKRFSEYLFMATALVCIVVSLLPTLFVMGCFKFFGAGAPLVLDLWPIMSATAGIIGVTLLIIAALATKYGNGIYCTLIGFADKIDQWDEEFHKESNRFLFHKSSLLLWWVGLCLLSVFIIYWPTIENGYFRYDDFEFISIYRNIPLLKTLVTVHGDHALPLYRVEVAIMYLLFGVNHLPYNIAILSVFSLTAIFSILILQELKTSQIGTLLFLVQYIGWTLWGCSLTGYYCLSVYTQAALFCLVAIWSYLKWEKTENNFYKKLFTISIVLAVAVDLAGIYVPIAAGLFLVAGYLADNTKYSAIDWFKKHKWFVWSLILISIIYGIFLVYVFKMANPGTFLSMNSANISMGVQARLSNAVLLYLFITNGLVLTTFFPGYNIFPTTIIFLINAVILLGGSIFTYYFVKLSIDKSIKFNCAGMALIILMIGTMVVHGRPSVGYNFVWAAKYSGPAYMWFCVLTAYCWNAAWKSVRRAYRPIVLQFAMIFLIVIVVLRAPYRLNDIGNPSYGYYISSAMKRYAAITELREKLIQPLFADNVSEMSIPTLDGGFINSEYDQLFEYNLVHYLDFIVPADKKLVLYRNQQMQEWGKAGLTTVPDLRYNISSSFMTALSQKGYLQRMYTRPYPLVYKESHGNCAATKAADIRAMIFDAKSVKLQRDDSLLITSNGRTKIKVAHGKWDPKSSHILLVDVTYIGQYSAQPALWVTFKGELNIPYMAYPLKIDTFSQGCKIVDLLQLPAYSLNPSISEIELNFSKAGNYIVKEVKFE